MKPVYIKARNLGSFPTLDHTFLEGCVGVVGDNGAGKSTLVDATPWALFGPDGSWASGYLTEGVESTELELELGFDHNGESYRVRRGYSARGAGKTVLDLERRNGAGWVPLTRETQKATQKLIEEITGLTRETLLASSVLRQDTRGWPSYPAAQRKDVIAAGMRLDRFEKPRELAAADRKAAQQQIERLTGALERADVELAERATVDELLRLAIVNAAACDAERVSCQAKLEQAAQAVAAIEEQRAARTDAEAAVARADAVLTPLEQRTVAASQAAGELAEAEAAVAALTPADARTQAEEAVIAAEARLADYRTAVELREQLKRDAATRTAAREAISVQARAKFAEAALLAEQAEHVKGGSLAHCPVCETTLGADAKAATLGNLRARAQVLADEGQALKEQAQGIEIPTVPAEPEPPLEAQQALADARAQLALAQTDGLKRERLTGAIEILRERVAAAPLEAEVAAARSSRAAAADVLDGLPPAPSQAALAEAQTAALTAKAALDAAAVRLDQAKADEARVTAKAERLDELAKASAEDRESRERLLSQVDRLVVLERAFGRDGIPAWIVETVAIPFLEVEANKLLGDLGGKTASARIELRSERVLKGGGAKGALDIVVLIDAAERTYERFSGGEKTRLDLALSLAFACLLESRGAGSRVLMIDEPKHLDAAGTAALAHVVEGLTQFDLRYLISHMPDLRHAFDQVVEVVSGDDGLSRIAA